MRRTSWLLSGLGIIWLASQPTVAQPVENLIIVTFDGVRPQEVFGGADQQLLNARFGGVRDLGGLRSRYWRETPESRRETLLPFLWTVVARQGQIFGDPAHGSHARLANTIKDSRASYGEMMWGTADASKTVGKANVLQWLNSRPNFSGKVAAYTVWQPLADMLNPAGQWPAHGGWALLEMSPATARQRELQSVVGGLPRIWPEATYDIVVMQLAIEHLKQHQPRVLYVSLNESDEWAHDRRYDLYLDAAHSTDQIVQRLWETAQSMPQYAGKTALVIATDHGRGTAAEDWTRHSSTTEGAENIWLAVMGPKTPALGARDDQTVTQSQTAATIAALLGEDYREENPQAAAPLPGISGK